MFRITMAGFALVAGLGPAVIAGGEETPTQEYYRVVNGKVDRATYTGWQIFRENCSGCHGAGGVGTSLAPDLTERIKWLGINEFRAKVLNRYFISVPVEEAVAEGADAVQQAIVETLEEQEQREKDFVRMPPWRSNPDVSDHITELYAYLTARADDIIGADAPEVLEQ